MTKTWEEMNYLNRMNVINGFGFKKPRLLGKNSGFSTEHEEAREVQEEFTDYHNPCLLIEK